MQHLAGAAAHDVATLRATLELEAELASSYLADPRLDPALRHRLARLITVGRVLSHMGAHFVEVMRTAPLRDQEPLLLPALLAEAATLFAERAARRQVVLRFEPAPRILLQEHGALVRHVLVNLVDNALKFSDRGSVQVSCTWSTTGALRVRVRDQGGVADPSAAGFGIGLSLLSELLRAAGGTLRRETTPLGTTVEAALPVRARRAPRPAPVSRAAPGRDGAR